MSDTKLPGMSDVVGKQWRGQKHVPVTTPESLAADAEVQSKYSSPDAISLESFCARSGVRDPVMVAGMKAYTVVRQATYEDWITIFANY